MQKYNDFFRHTSILGVGLSKRNPTIQSNYFKSTIFAGKLHKHKSKDNMNNIQNGNNKHFITDTDFIEPRLYSSEDIYNIVYAPFYYGFCNFPYSTNQEALYNHVLNTCKTLKNKVWRKIRIKQYLEKLYSIVEKLKKISDQYDNVIVRVPFIQLYEDDIYTTIDLFSFLITILEEIIANHLEELDEMEPLFLEMDVCGYPLQTIEESFEGLIMMVKDGMSEGFSKEDVYIVTDEMLRRKLEVENLSFITNIQPSGKYNENLYRKHFIGESLSPFNTQKSVKTDDLPLTAQNRIGVLYYMLNGKIDTDLLVKVGNFMLNKDYDVKKRANNAVYNYIHKPNGFTSKIDRAKYIISQLERYEIAIPKELEGYRK